MAAVLINYTFHFYIAPNVTGLGLLYTVALCTKKQLTLETDRVYLNSHRTMTARHIYRKIYILLLFG